MIDTFYEAKTTRLKYYPPFAYVVHPFLAKAIPGIVDLGIAKVWRWEKEDPTRKVLQSVQSNFFFFLAGSPGFIIWISSTTPQLEIRKVDPQFSSGSSNRPSCN